MKKKHIFVILLIFPLLGGALQSYDHYEPSSKSAPEIESLNGRDNSWRGSVVTIGEIEPATSVINIAPNLAGIVDEIFVREGEIVKKGQPLFTVDGALYRLEHNTFLSDVAMTKSQYKHAQVVAMESKRRLEVAKSLRGGSYSEENIRQSEFDLAESEIKVEVALRKLQIAEEKVNYSIAKITKLSALSPISGTVLTSKIHPGEYVSHELTAQGKFQVADLSKLVVRVQVDEFDINVVNTKSSARITFRDFEATEVSGKFSRSSLVARPKRNLSGRQGELIDTKTVDMIFEITDVPLSLYIGQEVDVYLSTNNEL